MSNKRIEQTPVVDTQPVWSSTYAGQAVSTEGPRYNVAGHAVRCDASVEVHIIHLRERPGHYRLALRCVCGGRNRLGRHIFASVVKAERAVRDRPIEQLFR